MAKDPAFPFYANDWLSSLRVRRLLPEYRSAFLDILCHCWASGSVSIEDDEDCLAVAAGIGDERWLNGGSEAVRKFFIPHPTLPGMLTNQKLYDIWKEREEFREQKRLSGIAGNKKRWDDAKKAKKQEPIAHLSHSDRTPIISRVANGIAKRRSSSSTSVEDGDSASEEIRLRSEVDKTSKRNAKSL